MKTIVKNISKTVLVVLAASVAFTSCKKDSSSNVNPLKASNQTASVSPTNTLLYGNWGNPTPAPGTFGTRYFNLSTGAQDSTGTIAYHLTFTSTNNLLIKPRSGATLKYLNTTKAFSALDASDLAAATTVTATTGIGLNTVSDSLNTTLNANGWLNYNITTHVVSYTHNVVFFLTQGTTTYAFKATASSAQGTATSNRGLYWFDRGVLVP
ncbi:hypothetical protein SAMN05192574_1149 [Mucilaginibacter gossypiicola]|uniref:HmuY protein n=1 Tax=Mucilaginibacter gossypiicola TaxID=551995 RepID=A0A1H8SXV3_9SPHI|nr:hypothetical protein [Mucilaginibacter gossypiicola]SEO83521.1 hypothetical protein SAMN05192574_1149 [Mucilaginibacter gossypiicola]